MQKCYNIMVTGKVQDIGFRALVEDIARFFDLRGFAFNDTDRSVKMVCCCENGIIAEFLEQLQVKGAEKGAVIDKIVKDEIPFQIYLPQRFLRLSTDDFADIGRKLDAGNDLLKQIVSGTSELPNVSEGMDSLNLKFDSYIYDQKEHNQWMKEHLIKTDAHNQ
ncbi:MAG: acylphosphatase, partial [Candidatus Methanoperedens sp.]|nr:acylphosphatase [Candidatus Methanoperedens sp.]